MYCVKSLFRYIEIIKIERSNAEINESLPNCTIRFSSSGLTLSLTDSKCKAILQLILEKGKSAEIGRNFKEYSTPHKIPAIQFGQCSTRSTAF